LTEADLVEAFEAAMRAASEAAAGVAVTAFRNALQNRRTRPVENAREAALQRYREKSWKRDVLECAYELVPNPPGSFRFSDIARFEKRLRKNHKEQVALMSGVNVTLQGLVKDGVLGNPSRGVYVVK
jgi:hypothetical protein